MGVYIANNLLSGSYEARELRFNSDSGGSIVTTTIPDIAVWHSNQGSLTSLAYAEIQGNYFAVDTTGVSGFSSGDRLMFALDRTAGKMWIGKNGTWFNSGDPAAGTNPQFTNMDCSEAQYGGEELPWRFFFATTGQDYGSSPLLFHLATGTNRVPQVYAAPMGFDSFIDPASVTSKGNLWNYRDSSGDWMTVSAQLHTCWHYGGCIALNGSGNYCASVGRMFLGSKYYWEMASGTVGSQQYFGAAEFGNGYASAVGAGVQCLWRQDGTLNDGAASITMDTTGVSGWTGADIPLMFALDLVNGKMWLGKGSTWFNSGDPAAGTNPQFSNIPLTDNWVGKGLITSGARDALYPGAVGFGYTNAAPSGFIQGIPLIVAYSP
jgi:hypothetical protein